MTDLNLDTTKIDTDEALNAASDAIDDALESARGFIAQAQETLGDALTETIEAMKRNPKTAAAIAAGAAATFGAVAVGVSKLIEGNAKPKAPAKPRTPRATAAKRKPATRKAAPKTAK